jgi:transmembrane sensor
MEIIKKTITLVMNHSRDTRRATRPLHSPVKRVYAGAHYPEEEWPRLWLHSIEKGYKKTSVRDIPTNEKEPVQEIIRLVNQRKQDRKIQYPRLMLRIAAMLVLVLGISLVLYQVGDRYSRHSSWQPGLTRETGNAERMRIRANDGSSIHLNSASQVQLSAGYGKKNRELRLKGEAYFEVQKDLSLPFVVVTPHFRVKVLGTSFCIKDYPGEQVLKITVLTGKVEVTQDQDTEEKTYLLEGNEQLVIDNKLKTTHVQNTIASNSIAWTRNVLCFENTPLSEVTRALERWYDVKIKVEDTRVLKWEVTGEHDNDNLWSVLEAIKFSHGLSYKLERDTIYLRRTGRK